MREAGGGGLVGRKGERNQEEEVEKKLSNRINERSGSRDIGTRRKWRKKLMERVRGS
jgi:hypothetical protein